MTINEAHMWKQAGKCKNPERIDFATGRRRYEKMTLLPVMTEAEQCLLASSDECVLIEPKEVVVYEFENDTAFPTDGFEVNF